VLSMPHRVLNQLLLRAIRCAEVDGIKLIDRHLMEPGEIDTFGKRIDRYARALTDDCSALEALHAHARNDEAQLKL
jgi:hypothetical protein